MNEKHKQPMENNKMKNSKMNYALFEGKKNN